MPLFLTACTAISALGRGQAATWAALRDRRGGLRRCDFAGVTKGYVGRVDGIENHELPPELARYDCRNNRLAEMALRTDQFDRAVRDAVERYGAHRVAVILGTSTSGVLSGEDAYRARDASGALPAGFNHEHTQDLASLPRMVRAALGISGPAMAISTACASSARCFADASHLIEAGLCDAAVVGGVDTLCQMTLRGFAALDLVSDQPCRPCDAARNGVSIGEAAGFALLERRPSAVALLGHGSSSDGHHMSSPLPDGAGAAGAMRAALRRAGLDPAAIDYVNLHGTGTRANDAMEDAAMTAVFGPATPCSSTKGWTGHTLGASGILEAVIAVQCLAQGVLPGGLGLETVDPDFQANILRDNVAAAPRRIMSNSFGFGGVNCSLILGAA